MTILLLSGAFALGDAKSLMEANLDQIPAFQPILKTNGELIPHMQEMGGEGNSIEQSPGLQMFEEIDAVKDPADVNDLETLDPSVEMDGEQGLYQEAFQGTGERLEETEGRSACPSGWSKYRSRCFRYISTERTWAESEQFCVYQGDNLASVHSRI